MKIYMMKQSIFQAYFLFQALGVGIGGLFFLGCDLKNIAGPDHPHSDAEAFLQQNSYPRAMINTLLNYNELKSEWLSQLKDIREENVTHMLARNPYLSREEREMFWKDKRYLVQTGVALNLSLSREEFEREIDAYSKRGWRKIVFDRLASNPSIPDDLQLELYKRSGNEHLWAFAHNPNCHPIILQKLSSDLLRYSAELSVRAGKLQFAAERQGQSLPDGGYYYGHINLWWRGRKLEGGGTNDPMPLVDHDKLRAFYPQSTLQVLLNYEKVPSDLFDRLTCESSEDILSVLAGNPYLTRRERDMFWRDKRWFVRYGVASNLCLSREEILQAISREPVAVLNALAGNPMVLSDLQLQLYDKIKDVNLSGFARNPNCHPKILQVITSANNPYYNTLLRERDEILRRAAKRNGEPIRGGGYYGGQSERWWHDRQASTNTVSH